MEHSLTAHWGMLISNANFSRLKTGFVTKAIEDKWVFLPTTGIQQGLLPFSI